MKSRRLKASHIPIPVFPINCQLAGGDILRNNHGSPGRCLDEIAAKQTAPGSASCSTSFVRARPQPSPLCPAANGSRRRCHVTVRGGRLLGLGAGGGGLRLGSEGSRTQLHSERKSLIGDRAAERCRLCQVIGLPPANRPLWPAPEPTPIDWRELPTSWSGLLSARLALMSSGRPMFGTDTRPGSRTLPLEPDVCAPSSAPQR